MVGRHLRSFRFNNVRSTIPELFRYNGIRTRSNIRSIASLHRNTFQTAEGIDVGNSVVGRFTLLDGFPDHSEYIIQVDRFRQWDSSSYVTALVHFFAFLFADDFVLS